MKHFIIMNNFFSHLCRVKKFVLNIVIYHDDISLGAKVMPRLRLGLTLAPRLAPGSQ